MLPFHPDCSVEELRDVSAELREYVARLVREEVAAQMLELEDQLLNVIRKEDSEADALKTGPLSPEKQRKRKDRRRSSSRKAIPQVKQRGSVEIELAEVDKAALERALNKKLSFIEEEEQTASFTDVLQVSEVNSTYDFHDSIWDASVLMNSVALGAGDTLTLCLCLALNIGVQVTAILVVGNFFLNDDDRFPDLPTVRRWRQTSAHDYKNMDAVTGTSLASQVCNNDLSISLAMEQQTMLRQIRFYSEPLGPFVTGPILCCSMLLIWFSICLQEVMSSIQFYRALSLLPKVVTRITLAGDNQVKLSSISYKKLLLMCITTLLRIVMCVRLFWVGSLWLVYTKSMDGLVLNALGLAFILDIDSIIFAAFVSTPAKGLLQALQPLHIERKSAEKSPITAVVCMVGGFLCVWYLLLFKILPELRDMYDIRQVACGGDKDFVIGVQTSTGLILSMATKPYQKQDDEAQDKQTFEQDSIDELIHASIREKFFKISKSRYYNSSTHFQMALSRTSLQLASTMVDCLDMLVPPRTQPIPQYMASWQDALRHMTGIQGKACKDFKEACFGMSQQLLRLLCPKTCGCLDPRSGLFFSGPGFGCPSACRDDAPGHVLFRTKSLPCEDFNVQESKDKNRAWSSFLKQMERVHPEYGGLGMSTFHMLSLSLQKTGCKGAMISPKSLEMLCRRKHDNFGSVLPWCPVSCGCLKGNPPEDCPNACQKEE